MVIEFTLPNNNILLQAIRQVISIITVLFRFILAPLIKVTFTLPESITLRLDITILKFEFDVFVSIQVNFPDAVNTMPFLHVRCCLSHSTLSREIE